MEIFRKRDIALLISLLVSAHLSPSMTPPVFAQGKPSKVVFEHDGQGFRMLRNGRPFFVKGVCRAEHLDVLIEHGGNSVKIYGANDVIKTLNDKNLTVQVDLPMGRPRNGFDYTSKALVKEQLDRNIQTVRKYMHEPSVLMWAVGAETEVLGVFGDAQPVDIGKEERALVWTAVEETARAVKALDPDHPVITTISAAAISNGKLAEVKERCPSLDAIGLDVYGNMPEVMEQIRSQGWEKPFFITEFGPRGYWEVPKTSWGLPIEDTSTIKAEWYERTYQQAVGDPKCLGTYGFVWGQKQERTHTWFGVFLPDGSPLGPVDALSRCWTGKWPKNRCPLIGSKGLTVAVSGKADDSTRVFKPGTRLDCRLDVSDPDGDGISITWDVRIDVSGVTAQGGDFEKPTPPIEGTVISMEGSRAVLQTPAQPGQYRIFAYAHDTEGKAATANIPIMIKSK